MLEQKIFSEKAALREIERADSKIDAKVKEAPTHLFKEKRGSVESAGNATKVADLLKTGERVAVIVFGKKLRRDGTLDGRGGDTVKSLAYFYNRVESEAGEDGMQNLTVVFTGGRSSSYVYRGLDLPTEASVMSKNLESRGVKAKNVLLEENSYDTVGNDILSYPAVKSFGASSIVFLAEKEMMNRIRKIADRVYGKSVRIIEESAEVALSVPYRVYNMVKEKVVYFVMFERNFKDVRENDIAEFTRRLRATSLYRH